MSDRPEEIQGAPPVIGGVERQIAAATPQAFGAATAASAVASPAAPRLDAPWSPPASVASGEIAPGRDRREPIWSNLLALIAGMIASSIASGIAIVVYIALTDRSVLRGDVQHLSLIHI